MKNTAEMIKNGILHKIYKKSYVNNFEAYFYKKNFKFLFLDSDFLFIEASYCVDQGGIDIKIVQNFLFNCVCKIARQEIYRNENNFIYKLYIKMKYIL